MPAEVKAILVELFDILANYINDLLGITIL